MPQKTLAKPPGAFTPRSLAARSDLTRGLRGLPKGLAQVHLASQRKNKRGSVAGAKECANNQPWSSFRGNHGTQIRLLKQHRSCCFNMLNKGLANLWTPQLFWITTPQRSNVRWSGLWQRVSAQPRRLLERHMSMWVRNKTRAGPCDRSQADSTTFFRHSLLIKSLRPSAVLTCLQMICKMGGRGVWGNPQYIVESNPHHTCYTDAQAPRGRSAQHSPPLAARQMFANRFRDSQQPRTIHKQFPLDPKTASQNRKVVP